MHQMFNVKGMTCENCVENLKGILSSVNQIKNLHLTLNPPQIHFDSDKKFSDTDVNQLISPLKKYSVTEASHSRPATKEESISLIKYMPLILLFALSAGVPALNAVLGNTGFEKWMHQFMGATLIALAYFKLVDLPKFAEAFSTYDPLSMKVYNYGYVYPFFELITGIGFILSIAVKPLSIFTILFFLPTTIGVIQALRAKRKFQCACLGTAFNLPLTKVTIVENVLMMAMSVMIIF